MPMPRKFFVTAGQRFGRGVVIDPEVRIPQVTGCRWGARLRCDCGTEYEALLANLARPGHTTSCGCWRRDQGSHLGTAGYLRATHGLSKHLLFDTWRRMLDRCENPRHPAYRRYGGRGISVCDRWHDVRLFILDIKRLLGTRPHGKSLDRIDNDGNYEPGNVRWATAKEQSANRSRP
jgi:hypothetical protein